MHETADVAESSTDDSGGNMSSPLVSVVTACFNEEGNLPQLFQRIRSVMENLSVSYEHIVIDNASTDASREVILAECERNPSVKAIFNMRNYGHVRSPYHGLLQARGDCVIGLASDLQEPPEMIPELFSRWRSGASIVLLARDGSAEGPLMRAIRSIFYWALNLAAPHEIIPGATGAGIYDRSVIEYLRNLDDPYPFFRGLLTEAGFPLEVVKFDKPSRSASDSKNTFSTLYDIAVLGFTATGRAPLRAVSFVGYFIGALSFITALYFFVRKLLQWDSFQLGLAPLAAGLFFLGAIQLVSLGVIGEYIGNIYMRQRKVPLVIEERRVNFES